MEGWICLYRKFTEWEWYTDANTMRVFLDLILLANHRENKWRGILIKRGQLVTSYNILSRDLGLSLQEIRTAIRKLKSTNEITTKPTNKYTLVTILKYDKYQDLEMEINTQNNTQSNNQSTINQQSINNQSTTNNNDNNDNNDNNNIYLFNYNKLNKGNVKEKNFIPFCENDEYDEFLKLKGIKSIDEYKKLSLSTQEQLAEEWFNEAMK